ncbi:MAG: CYTH domain-containing protein [Gammaproteobacteria bacterium]|nr:CYTH domain-containing protein [Gammaproteobacteria bacterium]
MPKEIERKFLIDLEQVELPSNGTEIKQGYFPVSKNVRTVVRVRIIGDEAYLTIKGENIGSVRSEFEYSIPVDEALEMLGNFCQKPFIEKTRFEIPNGRHVWEIDVFHGDNEGLVVAEIELNEESDEFDLPDWVSGEVTSDPKYYNSNLLIEPYKEWSAT